MKNRKKCHILFDVSKPYFLKYCNSYKILTEATVQLFLGSIVVLHYYEVY